MQKSHGIPQHQCSCQTYGHHCTCGERSNDGLLTRAASGAANPLLPAGQSYPRRALTTQESSHTGMVYDSIATPPSQLPLNSVAHTPSTSFGPILEQHVYQLDGSSPTSPSSPNGRRASTSARSANRSRDPLDPSMHKGTQPSCKMLILDRLCSKGSGFF